MLGPIAPPPSRPWHVEQRVSNACLPCSMSAGAGLAIGVSCRGLGEAERGFAAIPHSVKRNAKIQTRRIAVIVILPKPCDNPPDRRIAYYRSRTESKKPQAKNARP